MAKLKQKLSHGKVASLVIIGLIGITIFFAFLTRDLDYALLNPKGYIANEQYKLLLISTGIMLIIGVPAVAILYFFAWKYSETNNKAVHNHVTRTGKLFIFAIWAIPTVFALVLTTILWPATHNLTPQKPIEADAETMTIRVVALRWKWLFIYPGQDIATVNYVQIPVDTPIRFELTADETPMSSFWIPHLSGQLYAMTGHLNPLNLIANEEGTYNGSAAEINGAGFAGMKFIVQASSDTEFENWVESVKQNNAILDKDEYNSLLLPSENNEAAFYAATDLSIYDSMLLKYADSHGH